MPDRIGVVSTASSRAFVWRGLCWSFAIAFWLSTVWVAWNSWDNRTPLYALSGFCTALVILFWMGLAKRAWLAGFLMGAVGSYLLTFGLLLATLTVY
jgi:hypothetical protein